MKRIHVKIACVTAAVCLCVCAPASLSFAGEPVIIDDTLKSVKIGRHLDYLVDAAKILALNDILTATARGKLKWIQSGEDSLGFGFSANAYWVRFSVKNSAKKDITLSLKQDYPLVNHLSLYSPDEKGNYSVIKTGNAYPFSQRPVKNRSFVFPLLLKAGAESTYFLRYESNSSMNIQLSLLSRKMYRKTNEHEIIFYGMFYGILLVMFIYNLIMFFATRDWSYFYYIMYIASFGVFTMSLNGMAYQYLWPNNIWLGTFATPICMPIIIIALLVFARRYMEVRLFSRVWDNILLAELVLALITLAITFASQNYRLSITLTTAFTGFIASLASVFVIYFVFIKKSRPALFFSMSMLMFLAGVMMSVLQLFGVISANVVTVNGILVGAILQIIMLSFGLADRINILRNELSVLNVGLEKKVEERTAELQAANEELESINDTLTRTRDSLWGEMQLAKKIQTVLLPERPSINGYEISAFMKPADDVGGDYYDIINAGGMDWIVIGDVSGHGVSAGLVMMMVQTSINTIIECHPDLTPSEVLIKVNKTIYRNIQKLGEDKYMTITVLAAYKDGRFVFSGLHQDIMIYRKTLNTVELQDTNGMWIGIVDELEGRLSDATFTINAGDAVLLFTDGITEAWEKGSIKDHRNPETKMFGVERLRKVFEDAAERPVDDIKNSVIQALDKYNCNDDVTMIIIRRL